MREKKKASQLKAMARRTLKGKYGISAGASVITFLVLTGGVIAWEFLFFFGMMTAAMIRADRAVAVVVLIVSFLFLFLLITVYYILNAGQMRMFYHMCTGQPYRIGDLLYGFKNRWWRFAGFMWVWTLAVLILESPSIILSVARELNPMLQWTWILEAGLAAVYFVVITVMSLVFGQTWIILVEDRDKKLFPSFLESVRLMKGNKRRFFYLILSFTGVLLLSYGTFGIGFIWSIPYLMCTMIYFYLDIRENSVRYPDDSLQEKRDT